MHFKTGDKVRFLNETGSGIVKSVLTNGKVVVEIEDGFDIPYHATELVLANAEQITERKKAEQKPDTLFANKKWQPNDGFEEFKAEEQFNEESIYLVFEPQDLNKPTEGNLQFGLVNKSTVNICFIIHEQLPDNSYKLIKQLNSEANSFTVIDEIKRSQLDNIPTLRVDVLFYSNRGAEIYKPVTTVVKFKAARFFKENNYKIFKGFNTKLLATKIFDLKNSNFIIEEEGFNETTTPSKKQKDTELLEVDLHIEQLNPNYKSLDPSAILALQLAQFKSKLDFAITNQYKKAVFIHGVGNGVLKTEIRKILKEYIDLKVRDASFLKYGNGATEVLIEF